MTIFNSFLYVYQRVTHEFTHLPTPKNAIVYANLLEATVHNALATGRADLHLEGGEIWEKKNEKTSGSQTWQWKSHHREKTLSER